MKYCLKDRIQDFEFHDSIFSFVSWGSDCLVLSARHLNLHKDTIASLGNTDLEIENAKITFHGFSVRSFEPGRVWEKDENGNSYTKESLVIYTEDEARVKLEQELRQDLWVYHFEKALDGYEIGASGKEPYFTVYVVFDSVDVDWDSFCGNAWYEKK